MAWSFGGVRMEYFKAWILALSWYLKSGLIIPKSLRAARTNEGQITVIHKPKQLPRTLHIGAFF